MHDLALMGVRQRSAELPRDRTIILCCQIGSKATSSQRMLQQRGYDCLNLLGGYEIWRLFHSRPEDTAPTPAPSAPSERASRDQQHTPTGPLIDVRGLRCPGPILSVRQFMRTQASGERFTILVDDAGFLKDFTLWCQRFNHSIHQVHKTGNDYTVVCSKDDAEPVWANE